MLLDLPYPHRALWPNGRAHWAAKAKETKLHRAWAFAAMRAALPPCFEHNGERIQIRITVYPKGRGVAPDKDNALAAAKAYLDGVADALKVDDSIFDPQPVHMAERGSRFMIEVG